MTSGQSFPSFLLIIAKNVITHLPPGGRVVVQNGYTEDLVQLTLYPKKIKNKK